MAVDKQANKMFVLEHLDPYSDIETELKRQPMLSFCLILMEKAGKFLKINVYYIFKHLSSLLENNLG